jgi:hypothetical protein
MTQAAVQDYYDSLSDELKQCSIKGCKNMRTPIMVWHGFKRCEMDDCLYKGSD